MTRAQRIRRSAFVFGCLLVLALSGLYAAGSYLIAPNHLRVGTLPDDLVGETVRLPSASGSILSGWFLPSSRSDRAVVLLHGVYASRLAMLGRARFLNRSAYPVLLIDFQACAESSGEAVTFGYMERLDAIAAVDYVRHRLPEARIGVIGVSMGGAAAVLAGERLRADALVLEAVYPTLAEAVSNRLTMRFGAWAGLLTPVLTVQTSLRLGFSAEELQPIEAIRQLHVPMLVIAGSDDLHTTLAETEALAHAANRPKQLWVVAGAAHVDLHTFTRDEYERRVKTFLDHVLASGSETNHALAPEPTHLVPSVDPVAVAPGQ